MMIHCGTSTYTVLNKHYLQVVVNAQYFKNSHTNTPVNALFWGTFDLDFAGSQKMDYAGVTV